jgi:hypothetical protein
VLYVPAALHLVHAYVAFDVGQGRDYQPDHGRENGPNGTIHSLFMTSCDSVLAHQGAVVSPNLLGLRRPDLVVPRRRRIVDAVQVPLEQGWTG